MRKHRWIWLIPVGMLLSACGSGAAGSPPSSTSAAPSATASKSQALIVVADHEPGAPTASTLRLLRADGTQVQTLNVKAGVQLVAAAGSRIFVHSGRALKAVHQNGSVEELGDIGDSIDRFAASPDGTRWMWGTTDGRNSQVHLAGDGISPRVVAQSQQEGRAIEPFSWTPAGAFLVDNPIGIGGYILFDFAGGAAQKLDPTSYQPSPLSHTNDCGFSDLAKDATMACFPLGGDPNSRSLKIIKPDGSASTIQLAMPRFRQNGDAYFSRDGKLLTVAGATGVGADNKPEQYGTDLVTVSDASIRRLAIDGVRLAPFLKWQSWLDDGSLVVWRPDGAAGGAPGIFVVSPGGTVTQISRGGYAIGVLGG